MEENQLSQDAAVFSAEPEQSFENSVKDNSRIAENSNEKEGKSKNSSSLILGKFKSTEDLTKAYQQLEKLQGNQSSELGSLRERLASMRELNSAVRIASNILEQRNALAEISHKYREYFEDPSFRKLAQEAYMVLGENFDAEKLVNLVEGYVSSRILAYEKSKKAQSETNQTLAGIKFDKNEQNVKTPVKKSIQQMTPKELDALLDEVI